MFLQCSLSQIMAMQSAYSGTASSLAAAAMTGLPLGLLPGAWTSVTAVPSSERGSDCRIL